MDLGCQMSFAGTVAWMAPEVIRNELCNEKVGFFFIMLLLVTLSDEFLSFKYFFSQAMTQRIGYTFDKLFGKKHFRVKMLTGVYFW